MAANEKRGISCSGKIIYTVFFLTVATIFVGALFPWGTGGLRTMSPFAGMISNARQLGLGCALYAHEHRGEFPQKLADLAPEYLPDYKRLMFRMPPDEHFWTRYFSLLGIKPEMLPPLEWNYYGDDVSLAKDGILISSPAAYEGKRIVVFADQDSDVMPEAEFQERMAKQRVRGK